MHDERPMDAELDACALRKPPSQITRVHVADDSDDRGDLLEMIDDPRSSDIPCMDDALDAGKHIIDRWREHPMRV